MPVYFKHTDEKYTIYIWEIIENYGQLCELADLNNEEFKKVNQYKNILRKLQFLATRAILKNHFQEKAEILYHENGQPFLSNNKRISIAHSGIYVSVIISNRSVGIDIELINPKVLKIIPKFLSAGEQSENNLKNITKLLLYWGAKESIVKIMNNKTYTYNRDLVIDPFILHDSGNFTGLIINKDQPVKLKFNYRLFEKFILVWCIN